VILFVTWALSHISLAAFSPKKCFATTRVISLPLEEGEYHKEDPPAVAGRSFSDVIGHKYMVLWYYIEALGQRSF
jgi:hypothetical protein